MRIVTFICLSALCVLTGCGGGGGSSPPPIAVAVTPESPTLTIGQSQTFAASVSGTSNTAVTWSVREGAAGGTITSPGGLYTAPSTRGTYHVVAVSAADSSKQGVATVVVQAGGASGTIQ